MTRGLHDKYLVEKANDPDGKHNECRYFVLDPQHDPYAIEALMAYADAVRYINPNLAADIQEWIADDCPEHNPRCGARYGDVVCNQPAGHPGACRPKGRVNVKRDGTVFLDGEIVGTVESTLIGGKRRWRGVGLDGTAYPVRGNAAHETKRAAGVAVAEGVRDGRV